MAISLYNLCVPNYLQVLNSVSSILDKGKAHAQASGLDLGELTETRLTEDMLPLRFQIISTAHHSMGALNGIKAGVFNPPSMHPELDYDGLHGLIKEAIGGIQSLKPEEIDALEGGDMRFEMGDFKIPFTAEDFILSFSFPNFYFHATTTYDILRWKGAELGKMDFLGTMRVKG